MKTITLILCMLLGYTLVYSQYYKVGDNLTVVALDGLNVRSQPDEHSTKIGKLMNGAVVELLRIDSLETDTIFGFEGHWIFVRDSNALEGYVFDAFVSKYPVMKTLKVFDQELSASNQTRDIEFLTQILVEYALKAFKMEGSETKYSNEFQGTSSQGFEIVPLQDGNRLVLHSYYEGHSTELELKSPRLSEVYYLIMNLLTFVPKEDYVLDENIVNLEAQPYYACSVTMFDNCVIRVFQKQDDVISIFFYFPCC